MIQTGCVSVNGVNCLEPWRDVDPLRDEVRLHGRLLDLESKCYILLNKPAGFLSTVTDDRGRPTVIDLIPGITERVFPVGRLDYDSEGLLLLTNDGELANRLMHPRYGVEKTYRLRVQGIPDRKKLEVLRTGIMLEDGLTRPAAVRVVKPERGESIIEITIHEGRKRQVKRMFAAVGHPVLSLTRVGYGFLDLKSLEKGGFRSLEPWEVEKLYDISTTKG